MFFLATVPAPSTSTTEENGGIFFFLTIFINQIVLYQKLTLERSHFFIYIYSSADLEVQLVQLNHCDGVYSNY